MKFDRFGKMIPYGQDPQERPDELNYSAHISGPYCAGIYYGRGKNRAEHDNHRLSQLLYRNKQFKFPKDPLTKEEIEEICELMVSELIRNHGHGNIVIPIPNMEPETIKSQMKCAFPIAAGFAPILHLNFYDDVTHLRPFSKISLLNSHKLFAFKDCYVEKFYQLPIVWKFPYLKYLCNFIALFVPIRSKIKFLRFSKELMLLSVAKKD